MEQPISTAMRGADWHCELAQDFLKEVGESGMTLASGVVDEKNLIYPEFLCAGTAEGTRELVSILRDLSEKCPAVFLIMDCSISSKGNGGDLWRPESEAIICIAHAIGQTMVRWVPYCRDSADGKVRFLQEVGWKLVESFKGPGGGNPYGES